MKFSELSQTAKDKAVAAHGAVQHAWWGDIYDMYINESRSKGFDIDAIHFSGFSSQGDGACWKGRVYLSTYIKHHMTAPEEQVKRDIWLALIGNDDMQNTLDIQTQGHYSHSNTMCIGYGINTYFSSTTVIVNTETIFNGAFSETIFEAAGGDDALHDLEQAALEAAKSLADEIYAALEEEYDHISGEVYFAETCEANDWEFDEDGVMF